MRNSPSSSRSELVIGKILEQLPTFIAGIILGSVVTVYGALSRVNLLNYLDSEQNFLNFYSDLFGISNYTARNRKTLRGYIEKLNFSVNPNTLQIYTFPQSVCENAIVEGDRVKIEPPQEVIGQPYEENFEFNQFQKHIRQIIQDGFGTFKVEEITQQEAIIEINLLTEPQTCIRKPAFIQEIDRLLEDRQWKEADQKTSAALLKITQRENIGYLDAESIKTFSCSYLNTLDQLWIQHSGGRFGFSVQKRIFVETDNSLDEEELRRYDPEAYVHFSDLVRWIDDDQQGKEYWKPYDQLNFSLDAPEGHLPRLAQLEKGLEMEPSYKLFSPNSLPLSSQEIRARSLFFARVEACQL